MMQLAEQAAQILDIPKGEYFAIKDAISHSELDLLLESPAKYEWHVIKGNPWKRSAALDFGDLFDDLVLRPGPCCSHMAIVPPRCLNKRGALNSRGKAYKEWKAEHADKVQVKPGTPTHYMAENLLKHERAKSLLDNEGVYQLKVRWQCRSTGAWRRSMLDKWLPDQQIILDLKTTRDASPKSFASDACRFGYSRQAAFYQDAIAALMDDGELRPVLFLVVEKEPPYRVRLYELDDDFIDLGRRQNEEGLQRYLRCKLDNRWCAPGDDEITTLSAPNWAFYDSQWSL